MKVASGAAVTWVRYRSTRRKLQRYCRLQKASSATARQLRRLSSGGQTDRCYRGTADSRRRHQSPHGSCADSALVDRRTEVTEVLQTQEGVISHRAAAAQTQLWRTDGQRLQRRMLTLSLNVNSMLKQLRPAFSNAE